MTGFLDSISSYRESHSLEGRKVFSPDDELFQDHFPECPIVPGSLLLETMIQAASWLICSSEAFEVWPFLGRVENAKFRKFVSPGESLLIEVKAVEPADRVIGGQVRTQSHTVAAALLRFREVAGRPGSPTRLRRSFEELLGRVR